MSLPRICIGLLVLAGSSIILAADSVSLPSPVPPSQNLVSWQSAFLGLVTLALNAMTQPSGLDTSFSQSSILFPSRSSPFTCLADTLEVLISLCIYIYHGAPIRKAALEVNWQRVRHRLGQDVLTLEDSPAEKHPIPFGILFVATLLQAIKLLSLKGVPWTKVWAGLYLSSYVVLALVGFLAPRDWRENPPELIIAPPSRRRSLCRPEKLSKFLFYASLGAHLLCCSWAFGRVIGGGGSYEVSGFWSSAYWYLIGTTFGPCVVASILMCVMGILCVFLPFYFLSRFWLAAMETNFMSNAYRSYGATFGVFPRYCLVVFKILLSLFMLIAFTVVCVVFVMLFPDYIPFYADEKDVTASEKTVFVNLAIFIRGSGNLLVCFFVLWGFKNFLVFLSETVSLLKGLKSVTNRHGQLVVFACWNFVIALLYYRIRYDSQGTFKPSWTDNLG